VLPDFPNKIKAAYLLADAKHTPLNVRDGRILLPATPPAGPAPVLCVEIDGEVVSTGSGRKLDSKKDTRS
jgi:hypothetical protein